MKNIAKTCLLTVAMLPALAQSIATVSAPGPNAADIDGDGRRDIVFSCEHADGDKSGVMWIRSEGDDEWSGREIAGGTGIKFDRIELLDLDADGDTDVLACEERGKNTKGKKGGLGVFWYENPYK